MNAAFRWLTRFAWASAVVLAAFAFWRWSAGPVARPLPPATKLPAPNPPAAPAARRKLDDPFRASVNCQGGKAADGLRQIILVGLGADVR